MSRQLKSFMYSSLAFGIPMALFFALQYGAAYGIPIGLACGVAFGALISGFAMYQAKKFTANRPLDAGETLLHEGGANHFASGEAAGGWMYMTDHRLLFVSHAMNAHAHTLSIPAGDIVTATKGNTFGVIPNQLAITLGNGRTEKFVVFGAKEWATLIGEQFLTPRRQEMYGSSTLPPSSHRP
jgi:hypothetical protein